MTQLYKFLYEGDIANFQIFQVLRTDNVKLHFSLRLHPSANLEFPSNSKTKIPILLIFYPQTVLMMNTVKKINKLNLTTLLPFQLVSQVITQRLASQMCKQNLHPPHSTQKINILCKTNISLYCQNTFSSRNILIKIGHFQETPTACPSIREP